MIRLDKFLCEAKAGSRSTVKEMIKKGMVSVNGETVKKADFKVDETIAVVKLNEKRICYQQYYYYMLHKPAGMVSATMDRQEKTVLDLFREVPGRDLFPVGRLDKDTEGLLLITNDGELAHKLLSPQKHVEKTYLVKTAAEVTMEMAVMLEKGVDIGEEKVTLPAKVKILDTKEICLTITEGKFHQVKRMLKAVGNEVVFLKRLSMGSLHLDAALKQGEFRPLTEKEVEDLQASSAAKHQEKKKEITGNLEMQ